MTETAPHTGTWQQLVSTALVGTARRAVADIPELPEAPDADPASRLLDRAALATVQRRAGRVPGRAVPLEPAPDDTAPEVGEAAAQRLRTLFHADRLHYLSEWLDLAAARGLRAPYDVLPELLSAGNSPERRPKVAAVVGQRGRWLAGLAAEPQWDYITSLATPEGRFDQDFWDRGTPVERRLALTALRAEDPGRARELLGEVWADESAEQRRGLLNTFETGPSPADEPLLERALGDRSANVRGIALTLLVRLPSSGHADRLRGHARHCVRRGGPGSVHPLVVTTPALDNAGLAHDLALAKPKKPRKSDNAAELRREWLWTLVSHTPLAFWAEHLDADPPEIARLAAAAKEPEFFAGLGNAAVIQAGSEWARALHPLIRTLVEHSRGLRQDRIPAPVTMLNVLPAEEQCAWALGQLAASTPDERTLNGIVTSVGSDWNEELGERAAAHTLRLARDGSNGYVLSRVCATAATRMPPHLCGRFTPVTPDTHPAVAELEATLRFRLEMHKEFDL